MHKRLRIDVKARTVKRFLHREMEPDVAHFGPLEDLEDLEAPFFKLKLATLAMLSFVQIC